MDLFDSSSTPVRLNFDSTSTQVRLRFDSSSTQVRRGSTDVRRSFDERVERVAPRRFPERAFNNNINNINHHFKAVRSYLLECPIT
eukprot:6440577-Pyramimonas_sp.AAC.1